MQDSVGAEIRTVKLFGHVFPRDQFISRLFYLTFFASFGSLFPLLAVYFKQLGMTAAQAGTLLGCRPIIEFVSHPFWGSFASRFRKEKLLLLFSLAALIVFTLAIGFVQPVTPYCVVVMENEQGEMVAPQQNNSCKMVLVPAGKVIKGGALGILKEAAGIGRRRREAKKDRKERKEKKEKEKESKITVKGNEMVDRIIDLSSFDNEDEMIAGMAPEYITQQQVCNYNEEDYGILVSPPHSTRVYRQAAVEQAFLMLLLLIVFGEFFSAPILSLVDAATLNAVRDTPREFGKIRLFGSVGWGLAMFVLGIGLDYSDTFRNHPCPIENSAEKNYTLCFIMCSILMGAAMLIGTQFKFGTEGTRTDEVGGIVMDTRNEEVAPAIAEKAKNRAIQLDPNDTSLFAAAKALISIHIIVFMGMVVVMGFGTGMVFSFLFWHLQDLGGSPVLFGIASIVNHAAEITTFFYAFTFINKYGHLKILYGALCLNTLRFVVLSLIDNPWMVLPLQAIQGFLITLTWTAATSYITLLAPAHIRPQAQRILTVLYQGVGKGMGSMISGSVISIIGTRTTFCLYAFVCITTAVGGFAINKFFKYDGIKYSAGNFEDEECDMLAPQGMPSMLTDVQDAFATPQTTVINTNYGTIDPTQDAYDRYVSNAQ